MARGFEKSKTVSINFTFLYVNPKNQAMSTSETGKDLTQKSLKVKQRFEAGQTTGVPADGPNWGSFRAQYLQDDTMRDTVYEAQRALAAGEGRNWDVTEAEARYLIDKLSQLEKISYHNWLERRYGADLTDPVKLEWAQRKFPSYFEDRITQLQRDAEVQKTLARIKLMGPQTPDDFFLLYQIDTGTVAPRGGPLWNQEAPVRPVRGLFNVLNGVGAQREELAALNRGWFDIAAAARPVANQNPVADAGLANLPAAIRDRLRAMGNLPAV